jgi:(p)ppGpp synthase/HD superfamily hydrolase
MSKKILEKAAWIAVEARQNMGRKADELPDILHPVLVAVKLIKHNYPDGVVAAALVHDVLEVTDYPEEKLEEELGADVMKIVRFVMKDKFLSWEDKKERYEESLHNDCEGNLAVVTADKIHDLQDLLFEYRKQGSMIWKKYNCSREQKILYENEALKTLKDVWKHPMLQEYEILIEEVKQLK